MKVFSSFGESMLLIEWIRVSRALVSMQMTAVGSTLSRSI